MSDYVLSVDLVGGEKLAKALSNSSEFAKKALADALNKTAVELTNDAMSKAPHKSGRLRSSIPANTHYANPGNLVARVGTNVEYARAQEAGTVGMVISVKNGRRTRGGGRTRPYTYIGNIKPKWYLKNAKEAIKPKMTNYLQEAAQKIINHIKT